MVVTLIVTCLLMVVAASGWWLTSRTEGQYFDHAGTRLFFTDEGTGETVVLLHGFAVNGDLNWRIPGITEALAQDYRVITLDLRGHGLSAKPHDPQAYGIAMADDVIALLDHLSLHKAHIVGYSLGGIITLKLATAHPERMKTASVLGAGWERADDSLFLASMDGIAAALESGQGIPPLSASLGGDRKKPGLFHTLWVKVMTGYLNDGPALAAMVRRIRGLTVEEEDVKSISVPVCSIVGTLDSMKPGVDAMVGMVPDHTVVFIEGADHMAAVSSPILLESLQECLMAHRISQ
jgi:pimeloyl-ACP methyl ester carboxylesterase